MKFTDNHALQDLLAGQYVLGTMRGGARRRFERMCRNDASLQRRVDSWNALLAPLSELVPQPAPRVWRGLSARIPALSNSSGASRGWWNNLVMWRGLAAAMAVVAALSIGLVATRPQQDLVAQNQQTPGMLLATFSAPDSHAPIAIAVMGDKPGQVILKVVAPDLEIPKDKTLQLWLIKPGSDAMISAGVAPEGGLSATQISVANMDDLRHAKTLGLSLEPIGGSPQPTHALGFGQWSQVVA
jgi:anti-sigma-K factor RskA